MKRHFASLEEVLALSEEAIWNCTNQSSSYLFEDSSFEKQHYLLFDFEEEANHKYEFVFRSHPKEGEEF